MFCLLLVLICVTRPCNVLRHVMARYKLSFYYYYYYYATDKNDYDINSRQRQPRATDFSAMHNFMPLCMMTSQTAWKYSHVYIICLMGHCMTEARHYPHNCIRRIAFSSEESEPRPHVTCTSSMHRKVHEVSICGFWDMRVVDRHTYRDNLQTS